MSADSRMTFDAAYRRSIWRLAIHIVRSKPPTAIAALNLAAVIFLQKFAVPLTAQGGVGAQISIVLPIGLMSLCWLAYSGRLAIEPVQFVLYGTFVAAALLSLTIGGNTFSINSFLLAVVLYAAFIFRVDINEVQHRWVLTQHQRLIGVISFCALIQVLVQLLGAPIPNLETFVPERYLLVG